MKEIELGLADWRSRCSAFLLDYILTLLTPALTLVLAVYIKRSWASSTAADAVVVIGYLATAVVIFFNYVYFYLRSGQRCGKRFIGLRVVRIDVRHLDYQTGLLRHIV